LDVEESHPLRRSDVYAIDRTRALISSAQQVIIKTPPGYHHGISCETDPGISLPERGLGVLGKARTLSEGSEGKG
jgi:hypothetical protein